MVGFLSCWHWASAITLLGIAGGLDPPTSSSIDNADAAWDVIVVGAGTAGIIAAHRFSEAGKRTLLLEAGGPSYGVTGGVDRPAWLNGTSLSRVDVPGLYNSIFSDRGNLTCPEDLVSAFVGCTVGGTSAINAGLYFRPPASDWDDYHPVSWKAADVAAANGRLTNMIPGTDTPSRDGVRYDQSTFDAAKKWIVEGVGFQEVQFNMEPDRKQQAFGYPVFSSQGGQRGGPVVSYLQEALGRRNFQMETGARVHHVTQKQGVATGVVMAGSEANALRQLAPSGRVVLSSGALISPALLMYSGIGDPTTLQSLQAANKLSIEARDWVNNTAVGVGLFDSPNTFIVLESNDIQSYLYTSDPPVDDTDQYVKKRSGPYASPGQTAVFWDYLPVDEQDPKSRRVGLQGTVSTSGAFGYATNNRTMTVNVYGTSGLGSRGRVILNETKGFVAGTNDDLLYSDPSDGRVIARWIRKLFDGLPKDLSPLNVPRDASVADIEKYITTRSRYAFAAASHWSSSCEIGKCVDADAKVVGTENIHVVDASIVAPLTVNPQLGVMIAAEHAAKRILALGHTT